MPSKLTYDEAAENLRRLPSWNLDGERLVRLLTFGNFSDAMIFVNRVAEIAEEENHHPDIHISYNRVALELTSHDAGGLTVVDFILARRISALVDALTREEPSDFD